MSLIQLFSKIPDLQAYELASAMALVNRRTGYGTWL